MVNLLTELMPWGVVALNVASAALLLALIFRHSWGMNIAQWVGQRSLILGTTISAAAVFGSLFYSNIVGFEPCLLCWWQRIAIYPLFVLFVVALRQKDRGVFRYVLPLSLIGLVLSIYHSYIQWGGNPLIPCDAAASCNKLYVYAFGYVTIPTMVLSIAVAMLLLYWSNKFYTDRR